MNIAIQRIIECEKNNAEELYLNELELENLPDLPNFIKHLECINNKLKKLQDFPLRGLLKQCSQARLILLDIYIHMLI